MKEINAKSLSTWLKKTPQAHFLLVVSFFVWKSLFDSIFEYHEKFVCSNQLAPGISRMTGSDLPAVVWISMSCEVPYQLTGVGRFTLCSPQEPARVPCLARTFQSVNCVLVCQWLCSIPTFQWGDDLFVIDTGCNSNNWNRSSEGFMHICIHFKHANQRIIILTLCKQKRELHITH